MRTQEKISALAEKFRSRDCLGIAVFLKFMQELDEDERAEVFELVLKKKLCAQTTAKNPIDFFTTLFKVRLRASPFVDEGVKLLDMVCSEIGQMWDDTGRKTQ